MATGEQVPLQPPLAQVLGKHLHDPPGGQVRAILLSTLVRQKLGTFVASENAKDLAALRELIEAGQVTPAIDRTYPLSETASGIRYVQDGRARGKVVIAV